MRAAARLRMARTIVDVAARRDLVRADWNGLTDGEREDWLTVVSEVLAWGR